MQVYELTEEAKYQYHGCGYALCLIENGLVSQIYRYIGDESVWDALKQKPEMYTFGMLSCFEFCVLNLLELIEAEGMREFYDEG